MFSAIYWPQVHERGMGEDFLLIALRRLLPLRPGLTLVLMSATLDTPAFSRYLGGAPVLTIPGACYPVTTWFLEDLLERSGEHSGKHHWSTVLKRSGEHFGERHWGAVIGCSPERSSIVLQ
jgi:HrpA-like RNA helicase